MKKELFVNKRGHLVRVCLRFNCQCFGDHFLWFCCKFSKKFIFYLPVNAEKPDFVSLFVFVAAAASFTAKILSFETLAKREAILNPDSKQWISKDIPSYGSQSERVKIAIHWFGEYECWIVWDSEPIRLIKPPRSLSVYIPINDMQMSIYNRKQWHALSHSLHFVRQEGRLTTHPPSPASKSGSRLPIYVFKSVCLGLVPGHIDSPYLIIMSWITILRDKYLRIIPRAQMGSESIAHEDEGRMGYWLRGHEGERNNCFSKIQLVGQKYRDKTTLAS